MTGPMLVAYGEKESGDFADQSLRFAGSKQANVLEPFAIPRCNHFDVITELAAKDSSLFDLVIKKVFLGD